MINQKTKFLMFTYALPFIFEETSQPIHARKKKNAPRTSDIKYERIYYITSTTHLNLKKSDKHDLEKHVKSQGARQTYWYVLVMGEHCVTLQGFI